MKKLSLSKLESFLKSQCDALRVGLDASEYKDYIIAMIFLKRVNDQFFIAQENFKKELQNKYQDLSEEEIQEEIENDSYRNKYEFYVPVLARWKVETLPLNFFKSNQDIIVQANIIIADPNSSKQEKDRAQSEKDIAEANLKWRGLLNSNENVGDAINIALNELEKSNSSILQGVLSDIEFNKTNTNGEKVLSDEILSDMIKAFNSYKLIDENFEFPDLMGAAYEFLIKFFAESAGKKGGEFYTPFQVVELMGRILQPAPNAMICDPTVGSGGLLINMKNYVESVYGSSKDLLLQGQEEKESTYKMCKMNMIFHGIKNANIQNGDTLLNPKLVSNGELIKYDIVVANPPFSQNYTKSKMEFTGRFKFWMSAKKQADFMFVQHMISTLKSDGRMAVIMPHGVLFRGGEEQKMRKWLVTGIVGESKLADNPNTHCMLEAVIGLPAGLFYGTGIPASILVINKKDASNRKGVLFINADRDYKEGKNQNYLRPEDIDKISYVYTQKDISDKKYSRLVTKEELEQEEFNCNIRRWVDNAPEPDNQDVEAHLKGGLPKSEIEALNQRLYSYYDLKTSLFEDSRENYYQFTEKVKTKEDIKAIIVNTEGYKALQESYHNRLDGVWEKCKECINDLPNQSNIQNFVETIRATYVNDMYDDEYPVINFFQGRGAIAQFFSDLKYDFMSVVASGWNAELIPDEEILESQFPEVLKELNENTSRRDEIQAMFDEVNNLENEEDWNEDDYIVIPKKIIQEIKGEIKQNNSEKRALEKEVKDFAKRIKAYEKVLIKKNAFQSEIDEANSMIQQLQTEIEKKNIEISPYQQAIDEANAKIQKHIDLETELKECKQLIRGIEQRKDALVEQAREKITDEEAEQLIVARWNRTLHSIVDGYMQEFARNLQLDIENIYDKYTETLENIITGRDKVTGELNSYLSELGYATV